MKRGEVVDAETAAKITDYFNSLYPTNKYRSVIWPMSQHRQIDDFDMMDINLNAFPCQRSLMHLLCLEDSIFSVSSDPGFTELGEYHITVAGQQFDYSGELIGTFPITVWSDNLEIIARVKAGRVKDPNKAVEIFRSVEELLDQEQISKGDETKLLMLRCAILMERFAFSFRTTIKQRPTLKQAMNRTPTKREWPAIEIVNLRLPEKKEESDSEGRELTIRFYVKGHLRRQWRPSTKDHKLIWIDEHIRGPKDAPLKPKPTKVYKVTR